MVNGDLLTNTPLGMTAEQANQVNAAFFRNLGTYQQTHALQIDAVGRMTGPEARWPAALKSESALAHSIQSIDQPGAKAVKGDAAMGRQTLGHAVGQAERGGRLVLSDTGGDAVRQALAHALATGPGRAPAHRLRSPREMGGQIAPELLVGDGSVGQALRAGGLLATGTDAISTTHDVRYLYDQGNTTGAHSQLLQFGARNVGGWVGGVAGAKLGALVGIKSGPGLVVTSVAGAGIGALAASQAMEWIEGRQINHQADRLGNRWHFDPDQPERGWIRQVDTGQVTLEGAAAWQAARSGITTYQRQTLHADAATTQWLDYQASTRAVELRLASPDVPHDPYRVMADRNDHPRSLRDSFWVRDPDSGRWARQVADGLLDGRMHYRTQVAGTDKAAELDAYAASTVAFNAARSPAAIAQRYAQLHAAAGWSAQGAMPEAVARALAAPGMLMGSDGNRYVRGTDGRWTHDGWLYDSAATGTLLQELEATHAQQLRQLQSRTPDAADAQAPVPAHGRGATPPPGDTTTDGSTSAATAAAAAGTAPQRALDLQAQAQAAQSAHRQRARVQQDIQDQQAAAVATAPAEAAATTADDTMQAAHALAAQHAPAPDPPAQTAAAPLPLAAQAAPDGTAPDTIPPDTSLPAPVTEFPAAPVTTAQATLPAPAAPKTDSDAVPPPDAAPAPQSAPSAVPTPAAWPALDAAPSSASPWEAQAALTAPTSTPAMGPDVAATLTASNARAAPFPPEHHDALRHPPPVLQAVQQTLSSTPPDEATMLAPRADTAALPRQHATYVPDVAAPSDPAHREQASRPWLQDEAVAAGPQAADTHIVTGNGDVDDLLRAIDSHNELMIEQALERISNSALTHALLRRGQDLLDAADLQYAHEQAALAPADAMQAAVEVETRRGPVRVMALPDPAQHMLLQGDTGGDGGGG